MCYSGPWASLLPTTRPLFLSAVYWRTVAAYSLLYNQLVRPPSFSFFAFLICQLFFPAFLSLFSPSVSRYLSCSLYFPCLFPHFHSFFNSFLSMCSLPTHPPSLLYCIPSLYLKSPMCISSSLGGRRALYLPPREVRGAGHRSSPGSQADDTA